MRKITTLLALLLLAVSQGAFAQRTITGKVISAEDDLGMPGVPVVVKGTTVGTATDIDGNFTLNVPNGATIVVSFMGYRTVELSVGNQTQFNVTLQPDAIALGDVVVTALGIQRETKTLTYSAQQVSGAEMMSAQDMNFMGALQGRAAGLEVQRSGSGAGGSTRTVLRGAKSFSGSSAPLYVIDGVPMQQTGRATQGGVWSTFDEGDALSQINPDDIESISVLKGANSAMLYGSQGANGVIMITTKKGTDGPVSINFSNSTTFNFVSMIPDMQFNYGSAGTAKESWSTTPLSTSGYTEKDVKDFFQVGNNIVNNISISGGNNRTTVLFSYGNTMSRGIVPTNTYRRDNVTLRQSTKFFNDKVTISTNIMVSSDMARNRTSSGLYINPINNIWWFPRNLNINDYNGDNYFIMDNNRNLPVMNWHGGADHFQNNPWWILNKQPRWDGGKRFNSTVNLTWNIVKNLTLTVKGNYEYAKRLSEQQHYVGSNSVSGAGINGAWAFRTTLPWASYVDAVLAYTNNFGDFSLTAMAGASYQERGADHGINFSTGTSESGKLSMANVFTMRNLNPNTNIDSQGMQTVIKGGAFANITLGFKEMIFVDLSGRNDWSSTLVGTNEGISYFYPAIGLSGIVSQMVSLPSFVTFGKVRASYTTVANDMNFDDIFQRTNINYGPPAGLSTPSLPAWLTAKPEMIKSFEFGTDWRFLEGRAGFDFTYYDTESTNQRMQVPALQGLGYNESLMNLGKITNKGIELVVDAEPVATGDFSWKTSINYSHNKNKIVEVNPNDPNAEIRIGNQDAYRSIIKAGGSFGDLYVYRFTYDDQGRIRLNNELSPLRSAGHEYVGSATPDFNLGWNNTFSYKRWTMGFLVSGVFGGKYISLTEAYLDSYGVSKRSGDDRDNGNVTKINGVIDSPGDPRHGNAITEVNPQAWYQAIGDRNGALENYLYDKTNIRFTQFSLSYNVPVRQLNLPLRSASVGITGQNLFFLYKSMPYDPESVTSTGRDNQGIDNNSLPPTRTLGFNIRINF